MADFVDTRGSNRFWLLPVILLALATLACSLSGPSEMIVVTSAADVQLTPTRITGGGDRPSETPTITPSVTPSPTLTSTPTSTPTATPTFTPTSAPTNTPTPTPGVITLTPVPTLASGAPVLATVEAPLAPTAGWSCGDFPCEDDLDGFAERIRVPQGFALSYAGRLPGQPIDMTYGPDGRLYAVLITDGLQDGAIVAYDERTGDVETLARNVMSPGGIAFRPGTDILYVTGRLSEQGSGAIWTLQPGDPLRLLRADLPCCQSLIAGQPNGIAFGPDGYVYVAAGATTDHSEADPRNPILIATPQPWEGTILRMPPDGSEVEVLAKGFRDPKALAFDAENRLYASDTGLFIGPGDRLMQVEPGEHHGWPFWRERGCLECPILSGGIEPVPDWLTLPENAGPRGLSVYYASLFPPEYYGNLFVALWNGVPDAQRVIRVRRLPSGQAAVSAFVTGLIRPVDVVVDPSGALVVADYIYGHLWRVNYTG